jgi:hypothetical protein
MRARSQATLDLVEARALAALGKDPGRVATLRQNVTRLIEHQGWADRFRGGLLALDASVQKGRLGSRK